MSELTELDEAQRAQVRHMEALEAEGITIGGWKLGMTSGASRDALGAGFRPFGFVRADRIFSEAEGRGTGQTLSWQRVTPGQIETELCLHVLTDVSEPIDVAEARDVVAVSAGFELNQKRLPPDAPATARIEDNLSNWGIVCGEPVALPQPWDQQAMVVQIMQDGDCVSEVAARNHIDDHLESLTRLANRLLAFGRQLRAGDKVITGAFGHVKEPPPGEYTGVFSGINSVTIQVVE